MADPFASVRGDETKKAGNVAVVIDARQWEVTDIRFDAEQLGNQPADTEFSAKFVSATGQQLEVPGFWDGETEFLVRFTPPLDGEWNFTTKSDVSNLNERQGTIVVQPALKSRAGGVVIPTGAPRQFRYQNGNTYFPIAFECD